MRGKKIRETKAKILPLILALITVLAFNGALIAIASKPSPQLRRVWSAQGECHFEIEEVREPLVPEFIEIAEEVSLQELVDFMAAGGKKLYLPTELPEGLELTAIYMKDGPFVAVLVYDREGVKDPALAELVIQVAPGPEYYGMSVDEYVRGYEEIFPEGRIEVLEINGWPVFIDKEAPVYRPRKIAKFGNTILTATVWIDGIEYTIGLPKTYTVEQLKALIQSMKPVEA